MLKILLDQGDYAGAWQIYQGLQKNGPVRIAEELQQRLLSSRQSAQSHVIDALETWLSRLSKE